RVRVVPNKFPALKVEGNLNKRGEGIYDKMEGVGAHEVIVETPRHLISMADMTEDNIREVLWVYRDRLVDLKKDNRLVHGVPFETWILPKVHSSHFENIPKPAVDDLGTVLRQVLNKLEQALDDPPYNYIIHTGPFDQQELPHYHWHIEVIPRLTRVAGFEWGSGFYINPVPPEQAAGFLHETEVDVSGKKRT